MTTGDFVLEIPEMIGMPVAAKRTPQAKTLDWPAGTRIVSADSHMFERDCWHGKFPPELRDKMGKFPERAREVAAKMPNARVEVFEDYGHMLHLEAGERFHRTLLAFLAEK